MTGRASVARVLITACSNVGLKVDCADANKCTTLMAASIGNHCEIMDALLLAGASMEARNVSGWTALHFAAAFAKIESLNFLLINFADGSKETLDQKLTPLELADLSEPRNPAIVQILQNPPKLTGLPAWRPSTHRCYPATFKQNVIGLLLVMVRLRRGPLYEMHRDICKIMIAQLALLYIHDDRITDPNRAGHQNKNSCFI